MKIGVIHAAKSAVEPLNTVFAQLDPSVEVCNHLNEEMLKETERSGKITPKALRMFASEVLDAADEGADGIIVACSVFCSSLDLVRPFLDIPIIPVDDPALDEALRRGGKVGILATTPASAPSCREKLERKAKEQNTALTYEYGVVPEALEALKAGNGEEHDRLLAAEAQRLKDLGCNTLFLSQVSMARALNAFPEDLKEITLTTPAEGAKEILRLAAR